MKPIEIKVSGCDGCMFWQVDNPNGYCLHPYNMYDGQKESEFIEHCPLKESETIIKFVRDGEE